jgi:hypothetical protein
MDRVSALSVAAIAVRTCDPAQSQSGHEAQLQLCEAGSEIQANLLVNRHWLQRNGVIGATDQNIGAESGTNCGPRR